MKSITSSLAIVVSLFGAQAFAWEATEGRPFEGETVGEPAPRSEDGEA